jgi:hypothetical protein
MPSTFCTSMAATARLPLLERKTLLEPIVAGIPGLHFNGHEIGNGELVRCHACQLGFEGICLEDGRRAPYVGESRPVAQSEMSQPEGIRRDRMDRPRRLAAASRRAVALLLHR